jgi:cytochrome c
MRHRLIALVALSLVAASGCSREETPSPPAAPPPSSESPSPLSGKKLFRACVICHVAAPPDSAAANQPSVGPNLWGVYGRASAEADYAYSPAMRAAGLVWDEASLDAFIANPLKFVPGTRMSFAGEPDPEKRKAIIDYLKTLK